MCAETAKDIRRTLPLSRLVMSLSAICGAVGPITLVAVGSWRMIKTPSIDWYDGVAIGVGLALSLLAAVAMWRVMPPCDAATREEQSRQLYGRYLIGVGYFLLLDALLNVVALAGFANSGFMDDIFPAEALRNLGSQEQKAGALTPYTRDAVIILISTGWAVLGALFYTANSLWAKLRDRNEPFDETLFWGGLWFRLGEAVLFMIALFALLRMTQGRESIYILPGMALLMGMFLTSGEKLIMGSAERLFAAVQGLLGSTPAPAPTKTITVPIKKRLGVMAQEDWQKIAKALKDAGAEEVRELPEASEIRVRVGPLGPDEVRVRQIIELQGFDT